MKYRVYIMSTLQYNLEEEELQDLAKGAQKDFKLQLSEGIENSQKTEEEEEDLLNDIKNDSHVFKEEVQKKFSTLSNELRALQQEIEEAERRALQQKVKRANEEEPSPGRSLTYLSAIQAAAYRNGKLNHNY